MAASRAELERLGIKSWSEVAEAFKGADLLLGNGFSLLFSPIFSYRSLFDEFTQKIQDDLKKLFVELDTTNFERLQEILVHAKKVNDLLGVGAPRVEEGISALREGLVGTISENHPRAEEIDRDHLTKVSEHLDHFGDVYTTNYDLYLYHIIMICKDRHKQDNAVRPYNDYFWSHYSDSFLEFMDYQDYKQYKHAYYLHGALFLFPGADQGTSSDLKLRRGLDSQLIEVIGRMILRGQLPLFVTEGQSPDKLASIRHSPYLNFAYSKLKTCARRLVIFGHALGAQDDHIVDALRRRLRDIAIAIHTGERTAEELRELVYSLRARLSVHDVVFFDSATLFEPPAEHL